MQIVTVFKPEMSDPALGPCFHPLYAPFGAAVESQPNPDSAFSGNLQTMSREPDSGSVSQPEPSAGRVKCDEFGETMLTDLPGASGPQE